MDPSENYSHRAKHHTETWKDRHRQLQRITTQTCYPEQKPLEPQTTNKNLKVILTHYWRLTMD